MEETQTKILTIINEYHDNENMFFRQVERELFLKDIIMPPTQAHLIDLVHRFSNILVHSHLYDAIITFAHGEKFHTLGEANPRLIYNCVVWIYTLDSVIPALENDDSVQEVLTDKWNQKDTTKHFLGYKSASKYFKLFKNDYDLESIAMNMNLMELTVTNLFSANMSNVYDGCFLLHDTKNPSSHWINTYWLLNLAFACKQTFNLGVVCTLLFPALVESSGKQWVQRRLLSLKMLDALNLDIHEESDANYWDLSEVEAHLQTHLKMTSRKLMKTNNFVSL